MQWTERAGKRERNRVEFWLDVVALEPHLLEGVPLPWMLTMDDLETWLSLQPAQPEFSASAQRKQESQPGGDVRAHPHTMASDAALSSGRHDQRAPPGPVGVPQLRAAVLARGGMWRRRGARVTKSTQGATRRSAEGLERATSTRVGNLSIVFHEGFSGVAAVAAAVLTERTAAATPRCPRARSGPRWA